MISVSFLQICLLSIVHKLRNKFLQLIPISLNPLPDDKILDKSTLKQIEDEFLKCIQNGKYEGHFLSS